MKKSTLLSAFIALSFSIALHADTLNVSSGWQLLGATSNGIADMSVFNTPSGCVKTVFAYRNGAYVSYAPSGSQNTLASLTSNEGYWLNGASSCQITTSATPPAAPSGATTTSTGFTQADIDAAKAQAKTDQTALCKVSPLSCGISVSSGFTQSDIDAAKTQAKSDQTALCKASPSSCGITVNTGSYTLTDITTAADNAKAACKAAPSSCGITVSTGYTQMDIDAVRAQAKTDQIAACKASPSSCGITTTTSGGCPADSTLNPITGSCVGSNTSSGSCPAGKILNPITGTCV